MIHITRSMGMEREGRREWRAEIPDACFRVRYPLLYVYDGFLMREQAKIPPFEIFSIRIDALLLS